MSAATGGVLLLLLAGISPPGAAAPPTKAQGSAALDACRLLTAAEIAQIAGGRLAETKPTRRAAAGLAITDCFYRSEPFDGSVSLEIARSATAGNEAPRDLRERWKAMFHGEKEEHGEEPRAQNAGEGSKGKEKELAPQPVEGLGDEAFWIANPASGVLYVLKGDAYLRISVGGAADDTAKRRQSAELARRALARL